MRTTSLSTRCRIFPGSAAGKKWFPVISQHPFPLSHCSTTPLPPGAISPSNVGDSSRRPLSLHTVDRRSHSAAGGSAVFIAADRMLTAIVAGESAAAVTGAAVRTVEVRYVRQDTVVLSRSVSRGLLLLLRRR